MRIAIFAQTFTPQKEGGAEVVARRTAEHLARQHKVRVFSLAAPGAEGETRLEDLSLQVERLAYYNRYLPQVGSHEPSAISRFKWHARNAFGGVRVADLCASLNRFKPDVIYAHNATAFQPQLGWIAQGLRIPLVLHLHDYSYLCPRTTMFNKGSNCVVPCTVCRMLTAQWRKATERGVSDVVAVSAFLRDRLRGHGLMPGARWHVLHNVEPPHRLAAWAPDERLEDGPYTFGFLGALTPSKGLATLIEAFLALPPGMARLLIAGRGDEGFVAPLRAATEGADVEWLGHLDANTVLARINALVVPSLWHEPQGLVVTEGVNRNLTVIGSDRGGITEVLRKHPMGIMFDPGQEGALTSAMVRAMATRTSWQAPQIAMAEVAWHAYFAQLQRILEQKDQTQ
jgi:glycosyltransferase involved in cell wall biosynthesis